MNQEVPTSLAPPHCKTNNSSGHAHGSHSTLAMAESASSSSLTADSNWQGNYDSIRERNALMFNNELMADVHFKVGSEQTALCVPAHKYILATGSSVFFAMFYGGLAENSLSEEIQIPDVEPSAFLNMLR